MSDDGLLTAEQLFQITRKKRPHCQQEWFAREFGVNLPKTSERVILSRAIFEQLQAKRAGLTVETTKADKPRIYSVKAA